LVPILQAERVSKSFGPNKVLDAITLALQPGRVHAVIGENGAGKSTLMRILSGYLQPSEGRLLWDGAPVSFASPLAAEQKGVVLIHQEILLADDLTVAQNVFLGREARRGWFTDDGSMRDRTQFALDELGATISPDAETRGLSLADRQFVQIARALLVPHRVVIFDEPTTVLTPVEADSLFAVIRRLSAGGAAVLYISHRLSEVKAVSDMVTVLRDGRHVTTAKTATLEPADMARLMVGREMAKLYPAKPDGAGDVVLTVQAARVPGYVEEAAFALRRGEILGFGGLVGAGRTELFEGLVGLRACQADISLAGKPVRFSDPREALAAGVVYLSEDRKGKGLLLEEELRPNLTLAALDRFTRGPFLDVPAEERALDKAIQDFDIRVRDRNLLARQLSGGNQQKLFLAKMMQLNPRIIVIDEPTRGVDIGTKQQIYKFLADLADKGVAVIVISSEMQELIGLCHRVLVMRGGRIAGELAGDRITEDEIVFLATGVHDKLAEMAAHRA
jgi:ribose transport system ATP-binding protein